MARPIGEAVPTSAGKTFLTPVSPAGLIVVDPDDPRRPTDSGKMVYQVEARALELLRTFGTPERDKDLRTYVTSVEDARQTVRPRAENAADSTPEKGDCPRRSPGRSSRFRSTQPQPFNRIDGTPTGNRP
jgi:hypothetical protein